MVAMVETAMVETATVETAAKGLGGDGGDGGDGGKGVFGSHEELMNWVQNLARSLGVVVVTKRSNKYPNGFVYKVVIMCDRGGKYKVNDSSKVSGTKKTDCPFELEGKYSIEYNSWTLTMICDEHNHPPVQHMEGTLVNACKEVFPNATQLLCRWHISRNIFKNCRQSIRDVNSLYHDLCFFGSPCPEEHWMKMPEAGVLIANRFGVIIHSLSMSGSTTIFPFWSGPEESQHHRALTIALVFGKTHYVMVELQGESPMPVITPYWNLNNISRSAVRWETMYKSRLELYSQLYRPESGFVDLSD
ncbi:uncharacterized protein LOC143625890 [Bidens hawaiensis]|uniref:uncharacterized protein LOC143625890 n=1 Tax=Bidens hawaiensis TaxID=980011 RepID=UPI00404B6601